MPIVQKKETTETTKFKYTGGHFPSTVYMIVTIIDSRRSTKRKKAAKARVMDPVCENAISKQAQP
jgi:hypothetical protein